MLPEHLLLYLNEQIPCRQDQINQLTTLLNVPGPFFRPQNLQLTLFTA